MAAPPELKSSPARLTSRQRFAAEQSPRLSLRGDVRCYLKAAKYESAHSNSHFHDHWGFGSRASRDLSVKTQRCAVPPLPPIRRAKLQGYSHNHFRFDKPLEYGGIFPPC